MQWAGAQVLQVVEYPPLISSLLSFPQCRILSSSNLELRQSLAVECMPARIHISSVVSDETTQWDIKFLVARLGEI